MSSGPKKIPHKRQLAAQQEKAPDYVMSSSNIDTAPAQTLDWYYIICSWFNYYLVLLWSTVFCFLVASLGMGYQYKQGDKLWSKLTKAENEAFYYASCVFCGVVGLFCIFILWSNSEINKEHKTNGVIDSSLDVVRDVSLMYQNKQSKGLMHRGIASLFSTRNTTVPALEQHFRNGKIGKIFRDIEENL